MNTSQLDRANELDSLILVTLNGLTKMRNLKSKINDERDNDKDDGLYSLNICESSDGSGTQAELDRYEGNAELLDVIIATLEKQLLGFQEEFKNL